MEPGLLRCEVNLLHKISESVGCDCPTPTIFQQSNAAAPDWLTVVCLTVGQLDGSNLVKLT
jgi:hypothetical protein